MLGLDVLANIANVVYLASYSVRDILWLRILSVVGCTLLMPYYYFQSTPLWTPIGWNLVFAAINIYWVTVLVLDRRPVRFTEEERNLYRLALSNIPEREAFKLFRMGNWISVPANTTLLTQGERVESLSLIVEGESDVQMDGAAVDTLGKGRFLGGTAYLSKDAHLTAPVTVRAKVPSRIIMWHFPDLDSQLDKDTDLKVAIEASLGLEISRFLQTARKQLL